MSRVSDIIMRLSKEYPHAVITLDFENPLQLLVATILSAQSTDERVNRITPALFKEYRTCKDFAEVDLQALQGFIKPLGLYKSKAAFIIGACQKIVENFHSTVPNSMEDLTTLPGVGRKTANVILSNAFGKEEGIIVDTHVNRLSRRLGLTSQENPQQVEKDLMRIVPRREWLHFSTLLIYHGRAICHAHNPECRSCVIRGLCPSRQDIQPVLPHEHEPPGRTSSSSSTAHKAFSTGLKSTLPCTTLHEFSSFCEFLERTSNMNLIFTLVFFDEVLSGSRWKLTVVSKNRSATLV
ncbi:MAG: endonuclease III [Theionarchaea archaeon]|nr:endonuclease III [Theionarchaea archaeon]MBU7038039.1 endonuclease III [Theionarchaea archaeon]